LSSPVAWKHEEQEERKKERTKKERKKDRKWSLRIDNKFIAGKQDRQCTLRRVRVNIVYVKKQCVKYYENVSLFLSQLYGMQVASSQRHIILSSVACLALPYFSTLFSQTARFSEQ
jgi:hypothetical protein